MADYLLFGGSGDYLLFDPQAATTLLFVIADLSRAGSFFCDAHAVFYPGAVTAAAFTCSTIAASFVPGSFAEQLFTPADYGDSFTPGSVASAMAGNC